MNRIEPVRLLKLNEGLSEAAAAHCAEIGASGDVKHESADGLSVKERLKRYGKAYGHGENLEFNCKTALEVILSMLVDDGVENRVHRESLFNDEFGVCGIFSGVHKEFDTMTVIDYAAVFVKPGEDDPIKRQIDEFLKKEVTFEDTPDNTKGWTQKVKVQVKGLNARKTVTRTCNLKDGTEKELNPVTENIRLSFD